MRRKNGYRMLILFFIVLASFFTCVQEKVIQFTDLKGAYFGQEPPGENPELFRF